jgi:hypothetical protein
MKEAHIMACQPDEEILDWRAVCGRTARTVRKGGKSRVALRYLLYPLMINSRFIKRSHLIHKHYR